jgi:hypothetical protein
MNECLKDVLWVVLVKNMLSSSSSTATYCSYWCKAFASEIHTSILLLSGGLLVRTDNCVRLGSSSGCGLVLHNSYIPASNNATGGGDGLLVTNISASVVKLQDCSAGSSLNLDTSKACLQETVIHTTGTSGNRRGLLQDPASSVSSDAAWQDSAGAATAAAGPDYLVTSAAELHCFNLVESPGSSREVKEACSSDLLAGPGTPFNPGFFVVDGLGRNVTRGIYDAQMPMQVRAASTEALLCYLYSATCTSRELAAVCCRLPDAQLGIVLDAHASLRCNLFLLGSLAPLLHPSLPTSQLVALDDMLAGAAATWWQRVTRKLPCGQQLHTRHCRTRCLCRTACQRTTRHALHAALYYAERHHC